MSTALSSNPKVGLGKLTERKNMPKSEFDELMDVLMKHGTRRQMYAVSVAFHSSFFGWTEEMTKDYGTAGKEILTEFMHVPKKEV